MNSWTLWLCEFTAYGECGNANSGKTLANNSCIMQRVERHEDIKFTVHKLKTTFCTCFHVWYGYSFVVYLIILWYSINYWYGIEYIKQT